jgi:hypothetical protein
MKTLLTNIMFLVMFYTGCSQEKLRTLDFIKLKDYMIDISILALDKREFRNVDLYIKFLLENEARIVIINSYVRDELQQEFTLNNVLFLNKIPPKIQENTSIKNIEFVSNGFGYFSSKFENCETPLISSFPLYYNYENSRSEDHLAVRVAKFAKKDLIATIDGFQSDVVKITFFGNSRTIPVHTSEQVLESLLFSDIVIIEELEGVDYIPNPLDCWFQLVYGDKYNFGRTTSSIVLANMILTLVYQDSDYWYLSK